MEARTPLCMQVDASCISLVVWARGQQHSQDTDHDDLRDGLVVVHVPLVELLDRVVSLYVVSGGQVLAQKHLLVLFEVQEVLVFLYVLTLSRYLLVQLRLFDWLTSIFSKEQPHVDEEDDQKLPYRDNRKFQRDFDCSHADLFDAHKLAFREFVGHSRVVVVVDQEIQQNVQGQSQLVLQLLLCIEFLSVDPIQLLHQMVQYFADHLQATSLIQSQACHGFPPLY